MVLRRRCAGGVLLVLEVLLRLSLSQKTLETGIRLLRSAYASAHTRAMPKRADLLGSSLRWAESAWFLIRRILAAFLVFSSLDLVSQQYSSGLSRCTHTDRQPVVSFPSSLLFVLAALRTAARALHSSSLAHAPRLSAFHSTPSSVSGPLRGYPPPVCAGVLAFIYPIYAPSSVEAFFATLRLLHISPFSSDLISRRLLLLLPTSLRAQPTLSEHRLQSSKYNWACSYSTLIVWTTVCFPLTAATGSLDRPALWVPTAHSH